MAETSVIPVERIERAILVVRGHKVMLDSDLAELLGVTTFNLNKAVKRNLRRFPEDFMFQLTREEAESLRFQSGISNLLAALKAKVISRNWAIFALLISCFPPPAA
jgi:hypothetical protein